MMNLFIYNLDYFRFFRTFFFKKNKIYGLPKLKDNLSKLCKLYSPFFSTRIVYLLL